MAFRLREWFDEITRQGSIRGTRFRNGDRPPRNTFKDLTDSTVFRSESEDRAKEDDGVLTLPELNGHVVAANDAQAKANASKPLDRTLAVQPSQLPTVSEDDDLTITGGVPYVGETVEVEVDPADTTKNSFLLRLSASFKTWLQDLMDFIDAQLAAINSAISALDVRVTQNETDIQTNRTDIDSNDVDIAQNAADIATNAGNISTNTSDIATNTANIAQNTSDISDLENDVTNLSNTVNGGVVVSDNSVIEDSASRDANNPTAVYVSTELTFPVAGTYKVVITGQMICDIDFNNIGAGDNTDFEIQAYMYDADGNVIIKRARYSDNLAGTQFERYQRHISMVGRVELSVNANDTKKYFIGFRASNSAGNWVGAVGRPSEGEIVATAYRQ